MENMLDNFTGFLGIFGPIALLAWLTRRAWSLRLLPLKWFFSIFLGLVTVFLTAATAIGLVGLAVGAAKCFFL